MAPRPLPLPITMPISIPQVSLARVDALSVYTLVLAQCLALQVVKDAQTLTWHVSGAWRALPTVALALAVFRAHARPGDTRSTLALAAAGLLALTVNGSQSNHVLLELALCAATLLAAPGGSFSNVEARRGAARRAFSSNLTDSTRALLAVLYLCTGFAKLNDDWHDPKQSCCVQMFVGALAGCGVAPETAAALVPRPARTLAPVGAKAFELAFGLALVHELFVRHTRRMRRRSGSSSSSNASSSTEEAFDSRTTRAFAALGAAFHVLIALPPPPMSVYPFSMLMAPPYVAGLVPHSVTSAARAFARCQDEVKIATAIFLTTLLAHQHETARTRDETLFEYPAYFAWRVGATWTVAAFGAVAYVAGRGVVFHGDESGTDDSAPARADERDPRGDVVEASGSATRGGLARGAKYLPAFFVLVVSASPYFGIRTYPAFAMFSNVRVEGGGETNHWVVRSVRVSGSIPAGDDSYDAYARAYGPDVAVRVEATDLPSLRDAQINLAPLFPDAVRRSLRLTDVTPEFLIAPPGWGPRYENPEAANVGSRARPLTLPLAEARRRVSAAMAEGEARKDGENKKASFFVKFRWVVGGVAEARATEFRVKNGEVARSVKGRDAVLGAPLPWWRALVHRYRAFDLDASPCRH